MRKDEYRNMYNHQSWLWWYRGMAEINTALLTRYATKKTNTILDAGCGTGAAFGYLSQFGDVIGIDVSDEALTFAGKLGNVKKSDVIDMPFPNEQFDLVVCLDVLYHRWVGDFRLALKEFNRVLKSGGVLFIREPAYNWMRGSHDKVDFTKHRFTKKEIEQGLMHSGFIVKKITYANFFLFPFILLKRLPEMLVPKKKAMSDMRGVHPFLNQMLYLILRFESKLIDRLSLPWGSSIICVAEKA